MLYILLHVYNKSTIAINKPSACARREVHAGEGLDPDNRSVIVRASLSPPASRFLPRVCSKFLGSNNRRRRRPMSFPSRVAFLRTPARALVQIFTSPAIRPFNGIINNNAQTSLHRTWIYISVI